MKLFGEWPIVNYRTNTLYAPSGSNIAIKNAAASWNNAGVKLTLSYAGEYTRSDGAKRNNINEVLWFNLDTTSLLAQAHWWFYSKGEIIEADMIFNTHHSWSTPLPVSSGSYDAETIAMHGFGYWLNLDHSSAHKSVMFWQYKGIQRTLYHNDITGIQYIYGKAEHNDNLSSKLIYWQNKNGNLKAWYMNGNKWMANEGGALSTLPTLMTLCGSLLDAVINYPV